MEPTIGRFNQQIALATASGINFPIAMIRLLEGKSVEQPEQKNDVFWINESNDFLAYLKSKRQYGYLKNFFKMKETVYFSTQDLSPFFFGIKQLISKLINKTFG